MTVYTESQCRQQLDKYLEAEEKILAGQSYAIKGRTFTRADLEAVQEGIKLWSKRLNRTTRKGMRIAYL